MKLVMNGKLTKGRCQLLDFIVHCARVMRVSLEDYARKLRGWCFTLQSAFRKLIQSRFSNNCRIIQVVLLHAQTFLHPLPSCMSKIFQHSVGDSISEMGSSLSQSQQLDLGHVNHRSAKVWLFNRNLGKRSSCDQKVIIPYTWLLQKIFAFSFY